LKLLGKFIERFKKNSIIWDQSKGHTDMIYSEQFFTPIFRKIRELHTFYTHFLRKH